MKQRISNSLWKQSTVLVTGGTGSFGKQCIRTLLSSYHPKKIIVFSRDELKQHEMRVGGFDDGRLRYFIGDVRDKERLVRAMSGVDIVIHAAALKQVTTCEYNPIEAVRTNIDGARNIIDAALDTGVKKVLALSTDKAVSPVNLYGATKLVAEKLFIQANAYAGKGPTRFSCVRYGNVVGSRGSVIPLFREQMKTGTVTVTDKRMTRFWITLPQGIEFVLHCIEQMHGGEVFVPKIPSMSILELVKAVAPDCQVRYSGIRSGEKLHEVLVSEDEARNTLEMDTMFIITPVHPWWQMKHWKSARPLPEGFRYASNTNPLHMTATQLKQLLA